MFQIGVFYFLIIIGWIIMDIIMWLKYYNQIIFKFNELYILSYKNKTYNYLFYNYLFYN